MYLSRKPLQFALTAAALAGLAALSDAGEKCCEGKDGCDAECTEAIAHVESLFTAVVSPQPAECCKDARAAAVEAGECPDAAVACDHNAPWEELSKILTWKPETWDIVKPMAVAKFESEASESERHNVISLLAWQYSEPAVAIASEIAEAHPTVTFDEDQVVAFAEAGSKRFWYMVVERQKAERAIVPTALLALHGKNVDADVLRAQVERPLEPDSVTETFIAALALRKLGEAQHLDGVRARLHDAALGALDDDDVPRAVRLALTAEFLQDACSSYKPTRLSFLDTRLDWHCRERAKEVHSAEQVFALVEHTSTL